MKLKSNVAIYEKGHCVINTPSSQAKYLPLTVTEIGYVDAKPDFFVEREDGDYFILLITLSGSGKLIYNGNESILTKKSIAVVNADNYHYFSTISPPWIFYYFDVHGASMKNYYNLLNETDCLISEIEEFESFMDLILKSYNLIRNNVYFKDIPLCSNVCEMMTKIILSKLKLTPDSYNYSKKSMIENAIKYINDNYMNDITIDTLAKEINLSKYYFIKLFKSITSVTPHDYIINYRILKAKDLLRKTSYSVEYIASEVGFNDLSNFVRCFKKTTGKTPLNYKKNSLDYI